MDFVDVFPTNRNPVDFQDLISLAEESAPFCCPAFHHATHHHVVHVVAHGRTLIATHPRRQITKVLLEDAERLIEHVTYSKKLKNTVQGNEEKNK